MSALQELNTEIRQLPDSGIPGELKSKCSELLGQVNDTLAKENFYEEAPNSVLKQRGAAETNFWRRGRFGETAKPGL